MPDQLHLVERLVQAHRHGGVGLLPDHDRALALVRLRRTVARRRRSEPPSSRRRPSRWDQPSATGRPRAETSDSPSGACRPRWTRLRSRIRRSRSSSLSDRDVERGVRVVGTRLGTDDRATVQAGDLDPVAGFGLPAVGLMRDHDVQALDPGRQLRDLGQLLLEMPAKALGHLGVPTSDDDLHDVPPRCRWPGASRRQATARWAACARERRHHLPRRRNHELTTLAPPRSGTWVSVTWPSPTDVRWVAATTATPNG